LNLPAPFDNEAVYKLLCVKTLHGQDKDALAKTQKGNWRYDIVEAGYKCNMTDIMAAIGIVELARYDSDTSNVRRHIFEQYDRAFSACKWAQVPEYKTTEKLSCYHLYALRIKDITETQRDAIIKEIFDQDVSVNVHFSPVPMMSFYKKQGYDIKNYPVTFDNYSREISLPVYYDLTDDQVKMVIDAVVGAVGKVIGGK
jgi:dTDP-4-amino-4,6-dideoxygalactose transaminase